MRYAFLFSLAATLGCDQSGRIDATTPARCVASIVRAASADVTSADSVAAAAALTDIAKAAGLDVPAGTGILRVFRSYVDDPTVTERLVRFCDAVRGFTLSEVVDRREFLVGALAMTSGTAVSPKTDLAASAEETPASNSVDMTSTTLGVADRADYILRIEVVEQDSRWPIPAAAIALVGSNDRRIGSVISDSMGLAVIVVRGEHVLDDLAFLEVRARGYQFEQSTLTQPELRRNSIAVGLPARADPMSQVADSELVTATRNGQLLAGQPGYATQTDLRDPAFSSTGLLLYRRDVSLAGIRGVRPEVSSSQPQAAPERTVPARQSPNAPTPPKGGGTIEYADGTTQQFSSFFYVDPTKVRRPNTWDVHYRNNVREIDGGIVKTLTYAGARGTTKCYKVDLETTTGFVFKAADQEKFGMDLKLCNFSVVLLDEITGLRREQRITLYLGSDANGKPSVNVMRVVFVR